MNVASKGLEGLSPRVPGGWHEFAHDRAPATSAAAARGEGTVFETCYNVGNMFEASPNWGIADTELDPSLFGKPIEDSCFSVSDFDVGVFNVCGCDLLLNMVTTCRESTLIPFRPWVSPQRCRARPPWVPARFGIPVASDKRQVEQVIDSIDFGSP